jgi:hypothetical protein
LKGIARRKLHAQAPVDWALTPELNALPRMHIELMVSKSSDIDELPANPQTPAGVLCDEEMSLPSTELFDILFSFVHDQLLASAFI